MKSKFFNKEGIPNCFALKKYRIIQRITGVHYVHDVCFSYGIKMPFSNWGYFPAFHRRWADLVKNGLKINHKEWAETPWHKISKQTYHDCTATGNY